MALVLVRLGDAQREHRHGQQLERVFERGAVRDLGQGGVLLAGLFVGGRLESAEGALDWAGLVLVVVVGGGWKQAHP